MAKIELKKRGLSLNKAVTTSIVLSKIPPEILYAIP